MTRRYAIVAFSGAVAGGVVGGLIGSGKPAPEGQNRGYLAVIDGAWGLVAGALVAVALYAIWRRSRRAA